MSLADSLSNRHRADPVAENVSTGSSTDSALPTTLEPEPSKPQRAAKPGLMNFANLPQLKRSAPSTPNTTMNGSSSATDISSAGSSTSSTPGTPIWAAQTRQTPSASPRLARTGQSSTTTVLMIPSDREAVLRAVKEVMDERGVTIEMAKSAAPSHATFMIKGKDSSAVEAARIHLDEALQPHVTQETIVPSSARAALIGPKGSNLRSLETKFHATIDLSAAPSSTWSLERTVVTVSGSERNVEKCIEQVNALVDVARRVASARAISLELGLLLAQQNLEVSKNRVVLQGPLPSVLADMQRIDALIAQIEETHIRAPYQSPAGFSVPTDILLAHNAVVLPGGEVYAPRKTVAQAVAAVEQFLATQHHSELDISRAHADDQAHARVLARYFAATGVIDKIASEHGVAIALKPDSENVIYVFSGEEKASMAARRAVVSEVKAHSPASLAVVRGMRYALVRKRAQEITKQLTGPVDAVIGPSDELFVVFNDPGDDFAPSEADIRKHLSAAIELLEPLTSLAANLAKKSVVLNADGDATLAANPQGPEAIALRKSLQNVEFEVKDPRQIVVSGMKSQVQEACELLPRIVALSRQHAVRASFVEEFNVDPQLVRNLIGRNGAQIQQFRNQYDVKVEVDQQGHVRVQGVETQAKECMRAILDFQKRLRDEVVEQLEIPAEYHVKLIGPKGKHVKRLREKYQCLIKFPPSRQESEESQDSTEISGTGDVITIRGPSRGVSAIKREFLELVAYEKQQSYSTTIEVPSSVVSRLVGKNGVAVNSIKRDTGAEIDFGTATKDKETVDIVVTGEQKAVAAAVKQLQDAAATAADLTEVTVQVPLEFQRLLTGHQNSVRRELVAEAGGDPENATKTLIVPQSSANSTTVRLVGPSAVVAKLETKVKSLITDAQRRSIAAIELQVPRSSLGQLLGLGGQKRRDLETHFDVNINIFEPSDRRTVAIVTVSGESKEVAESAVSHIRELTLPETTKIDFASAGWTLSLKRTLQLQFHVRARLLSEPKQKLSIPERPEQGTAEVVELPVDSKLELAGKTREDLAKAETYLAKRGVPNTLCHLWLPVASIGQVIGPGGRTIKSIRQKTECSIELPEVGRDEPVSLVGTREQVDAAKAALLEAST